MKEYPILFSGSMVRAILDGRKTMTRRVVKPQFSDNPFMRSGKRWGLIGNDLYVCGVRSPYGKPGDRLWARETWDFRPLGDGTAIIGYRDSTTRGVIVPDNFKQLVYNKLRFRPSIHMPRWASRITLEVTGVRVERVQEITEVDAIKEGIHYEGDRIQDGKKTNERGLSVQKAFCALWDSLNAKRGYGWDKNPWVWVIEFKRIVDGKAN